MQSKVRLLVIFAVPHFVLQYYLTHFYTMFAGVTPSKDAFLSQARTAREIRQNAKSQNESAVRIQKVIRGWLCRRKLRREIR